jgi:hypothetical protein
MKTLLILSLLMVGCITEPRPEDPSDIRGIWKYADIYRYDDIEVTSFEIFVQREGAFNGLLQSPSFSKKMGFVYYRDTLDIKIVDRWHRWVR